MNTELREFMTMIIPLMLQLAGLAFAVSIDSYISRKNRGTIRLIVFLVFVLIFQNYYECLLDQNGSMILLRTIMSIMGYTLRPVILLTFIFIVDESKPHKIGWTLVILNAAIHMTALFSDICFSIGHDNSFKRGPLGFTSHIISGILLSYLLFVTIAEYKKRGWRELLIPMLNVVMIVTAVFADSLVTKPQPVTYLTMAIVSSSVFFYIWLHLQFVRQHEEALRAEQRIQIMISQIQPHFMYNTLSTIQSLCHSNPEKAAEVTERFGTYLRQNLNSLKQTKLIPVMDELEHTRTYADIEMVRFPKLTVEYDIQDEDFSLPALSIQPLVENAIRHGVRGMSDGRVVVSARMKEGYHEVMVQDNGKGFDVESKRAETKENHIGLSNVKERIEAMCRGTMVAESSPGKGTTVTIRIPESGKTA